MDSHQILIQPAQDLHNIQDNSIELVVTSPPYPMIEMWDEIFGKQNPAIKKALENEDGNLAFSLMHGELDKVWNEVYRVLKLGGIACINIGDTTRTIGKNFQVFPSHARIINACQQIGFQNLPEILWRKQTNAPNKFMGSGMLPPGAYVTLEHEYILIFRKGRKREFKSEELKQNRRESAYFWEERNIWFSDLWDFKGTSQGLSNKETRKRSATYPFELAYRLINMFSVKGDTVLDPFLGTGTTTLAAMLSQRNSVGVEINPSFIPIFKERTQNFIEIGNSIITTRLKNHQKFVTKRTESKGPLKYHNTHHDIPVMTMQERNLQIHYIEEIFELEDGKFTATYKK